MDLLEYMNEMNKEKESPLASRLRPTTLDEVVGQEHIIGKDKLLYRAIKADKLSSILALSTIFPSFSFSKSEIIVFFSLSVQLSFFSISIG